MTLLLVLFGFWCLLHFVIQLVLGFILAIAVLCVRVFLDPGLDLSDPGIHPGVVGEGTPSAPADHPNLGIPGQVSNKYKVSYII